MGAHFVRAVSLSLVLAACGGGTDSKTPSIGGDYVLLTLDGRNLPTESVTPDPDKGGPLITETLLDARLEVSGSSARDIKKRKKSNSPTVITDTLILTLSRTGDRTFLMRPSDQPTAQPDTATVADGIVPNALLTLRTRYAASGGSPTRQTLVYTLQK